MSIQIPALVRYALKYGVASYVGQGLSTWSQVHVRDLARGYVTIVHWMEQTTADEVLSNPYWFCENGDDLVWYDCAKAIGEALHAAGYLESPIPKTIPPETYGDIFGDATPLALGSNSRNKASRLRSLGWKPVEKSLFTTLREDELPVILKNAKPPAV